MNPMFIKTDGDYVLAYKSHWGNNIRVMDYYRWYIRNMQEVTECMRTEYNKHLAII